ncbi:MAG: ABC transporter substrate-binding protein, partial [Deltaproteobacteria bacterium]|nr:ABC transporter substrate-binding protein [Deltaproteobacteria bacterium]
LKTIPYDPALAQDLLAAAGWKDTNRDGVLDKDGKPFDFVFLYPASSKFSERVAPILKEDLEKIGIIMRIEKMEWAAFIGKIEKKEFDATALGWSTGFEDDPYQVWHSSQSKIDRGSNFVSFENVEADRVMEAARTEFDKNRRNALYAKLQKIIQEEQPYTFLFCSSSLVAVSKRFKNVKVHKTGLDILEWDL